MSHPWLFSHTPSSTSTSSSSPTYPTTHREHSVHTAHLQAQSVDKLRHQESLWREDLQSGGNPRTTTPTEPVACAASQTGIFDTGTHNAVSALLHAAAGACFVFVVCCCVGVPVVDVGMYVCGAACYACCGVLQRRHTFDPFLKRIIGKRQP